MIKNNKFLYAALRSMIIITSFLICAVLIVGITLSRYETTIKKSVNFRSEEMGMLDIKSDKGWTVADGTLSMDFEVTNSACSPDGVEFVLYLAASPASEAESASVILIIGETEYTAVSEEIDPESSLYRAFGYGYVYRFYSSSEEKLQQMFELNKKSEENEEILTSEKMTVKISGKTGDKEIDSVGLIKLYAVLG